MSNWFYKIAQKINIQIEMDDFAEKCRQQLFALVENTRERMRELQSFDIDMNVVQNSIAALSYPDSTSMLQSIQSGDHDQILQSYFALHEWSRQTKLDPQQRDAAYNLSTQLRKLIDKIDPYDFTESDAEQYANETINKTLYHMNQIKGHLLTVISSIPTWSTPLIRIVPNALSNTYNFQDDYATPTSSALVEFGNSDMAPSFSYFMDEETGKVEIDDILEAGDQDFFEDVNTERDYFTLVREIKNPGSTQRPGKFVTLYTARLSKDRNVYLNADSVPAGIYLADNLSHVEDLARDLPGGNRDIWKVVINEQYLLKDLEMPGYKHYQVMGHGKIPVKKLVLLSTGDENGLY